MDAARNGFLRHRAGALAQPERLQSKMLDALHPGQLQRPAGAMDGATVDDQHTPGILGDGHQVPDASADAGEAGHFRHALPGELSRDPVGEFAGIRTAGAGLDDGFIRGRLHGRDGAGALN